MNGISKGVKWAYCPFTSFRTGSIPKSPPNLLIDVPGPTSLFIDEILPLVLGKLIEELLRQVLKKL